MGDIVARAVSSSYVLCNSYELVPGGQAALTRLDKLPHIKSLGILHGSTKLLAEVIEPLQVEDEDLRQVN